MATLVVQAAPNPYRPLRAEYSYTGAAVVAALAAAPLLELDPSAKLLVLVEDRYSAWPQARVLPRAQSYEELVRVLQHYMRRICGKLLPTKLCPRAVFRVAPSRGEAGSWRFTASTGDTVLAALEAIIGEATGPSQQLRLVYVVDPNAAPAVQAAALTAAAAAAEAVQAELEVLAAPPPPEPAPAKPPLLELHPIQPPPRLQAPCPTGRPMLLEAKPPAKPPRLQGVERDARLTLASAAMRRKCMLLPLAYQACGAGNPVEKLRRGLRALVDAYTGHTLLRKKRVGGIVYHQLEANSEVVAALAAGAGAELAALQALRDKGASCEKVYTEGVPAEALETLGEKLGCPCDTTPTTCVDRAGDTLRLRSGCLKTLRSQLLGQQA